MCLSVGCIMSCSDIRVPSSGELHIYAPRSTQGFSVCDRDCMRYGAFDVPHSHKMTTPLIQGVMPDGLEDA